MPELPEVETTRRGIMDAVLGKKISKITVRNGKLRRTVSPDFADLCQGQNIQWLSRRAKYLIFGLKHGYILLHLGMSGHLRLVPLGSQAKKHDHVDIEISNQIILRYNDPRRFGLIQWSTIPLDQHPLLKRLGPEPLTEDFNSCYLHCILKKRKSTIKSLIMNNSVVVGVGNIYASESLFLSGIHPARPGNTLELEECETLVCAIKKILSEAILQGGTTLKDFLSATGKPGYFSQSLKVYGREGEACDVCTTVISSQTIAQRNSFYCHHCQIYTQNT